MLKLKKNRLKILIKFLFLIILVILFILYSKIPTNTIDNVRYHSIYSFSSSRLKEYANIHEKIIDSDKNQVKKIVFNEAAKAGYANKVYAVISSLVIAILTDSALILDWQEINKFVKPPLKDVLTQFNESSQLSIHYELKRFNLILPQETLNSWKYSKNYDFLINNSIPKFHRIVYRGYASYFFDLCSNPDYYQKLLEYDLVKKETIQEAKNCVLDPIMEKSEKIEKLYMIGFEVGSTLMNQFWLLEPNFLTEINDFYDLHFKNNFVIGLQFRFEYLNEEDIEKFIVCANYLEKISRGYTIKWFVTSDSNKIFSLLKKYKIQIIEGKGKLGHIVDDKANYYRTIFDNELLSRSNEIIITGGSTYGFLAALKKGKLPFYVNGKRNYKYDINQPCKRMTFNHGPINPNNYNLI